uniref:DUF630 domain-containing protein n=1 Tax=Oryza barthii TaxID=65489 RepID=A0A0D3EP89_9ORYZ
MNPNLVAEQNRAARPQHICRYVGAEFGPDIPATSAGRSSGLPRWHEVSARNVGASMHDLSAKPSGAELTASQFVKKTVDGKTSKVDSLKDSPNHFPQTQTLYSPPPEGHSRTGLQPTGGLQRQHTPGQVGRQAVVHPHPPPPSPPPLLTHSSPIRPRRRRIWSTKNPFKESPQPSREGSQEFLSIAAWMGCGQSKIDQEEAVCRCRDRRKLMADAVQARNAFAAAHSAYTVLLKSTGGALSDRAHRALPAAPALPRLLPRHTPALLFYSKHPDARP